MTLGITSLPAFMQSLVFARSISLHPPSHFILHIYLFLIKLKKKKKKIQTNFFELVRIFTFENLDNAKNIIHNYIVSRQAINRNIYHTFVNPDRSYFITSFSTKVNKDLAWFSGNILIKKIFNILIKAFLPHMLQEIFVIARVFCRCHRNYCNYKCLCNIYQVNGKITLKSIHHNLYKNMFHT